VQQAKGIGTVLAFFCEVAIRSNLSSLYNAANLEIIMQKKNLSSAYMI
jgi:hypothetical protein